MSIPIWVDFTPDLSQGKPDWHAVHTITLGELIDPAPPAMGIDFEAPEWNFDAFDDDQRKRLWKKFAARFYWAEIGSVPPLRWQRQLIAKLNEIMPKYKPLYKALEDGYDPLRESSERHRRRDIRSDYPQTVLKTDSQDYASSGNETVYETIREGDIIEKADALRYRYSDVDAMILDELEIFFVPLTTANVNGF